MEEIQMERGIMTMNEDLKTYPVYALMTNGLLYKLDYIKSTSDYNHSTHHIHHYIKQQEYNRNKQWFDDRGIKQKLFLLPVWLHHIVHNDPAGANLTDEEFFNKFKISRWDLLFNRRYSKY